MDYIFMNKNVPVLEFSMIEGHVLKINKLLNPEYLPFSLAINKKREKIAKSDLEKFFRWRAIPDTRQNLDEILKASKVKTPYDLNFKYYGLSLSDQYWIKEKKEEVFWKDINFFTNDFSEDLGQLMVGKEVKNISLKTPDNTTDGWLKKSWANIEGKRVLIKGGSKPYMQEPFNEKIAYEIGKSLGLNHIRYDLKKIGKEYFSLCENFIDENTELITANSFLAPFKKPNHISYYEFIIEKMGEVGVKEARRKMDELMYLDYVIYNEDRHYNNFGLIRDVNTLKIIDLAPIYDSGTSLFYDTSTKLIKYANPKTKPFFEDRAKQRKLIREENIPKTNRDEIYKIIIDVFSENEEVEEFFKDRKEEIAKRISEKL